MGGYTTETYTKALKKRWGNKFEVLSEYTKSTDKVKIRCNDCGEVSEKQAVRVLQRGKCERCGAIKRIKTHEKFVRQIKERHGDEITVLGKYTLDKNKVLVRHNPCGAEYEVTATSILQKPYCMNCRGDRARRLYVKTHDQFVKDVKQKHGEKYEVLGRYHNAQTKILVRHNECGYEWKIRPINLLVEGESRQALKSCPKCRLNHMRCKDPQVRQMVRNIRSRIIHILQGRKKSLPTLQLTGCKNRDELRRHIEEKFKPGMTWDNYGTAWHVDHIRPCASFDLSDKEQQKECFHYSNLQPLWADENIKKNSIYNGNRYYFGGEANGTKAEIRM